MNKKIFRLMSICMTFVLMLGNSYNVGAASAYGEQFSQSRGAAALSAFPRGKEFRANILGGQSGTADEITITNGSSNVSPASHAEATMPMANLALTENPILINALTRPMKYYGVDRGSPYTDANYATLAQHAVKTIIVDTFINDANNSSSAKWSHIKALAAQYNFNYVIWPNQGGDVPGCGWETPFNSPQNGDYIWRVTTMLDSFTTDPHFIGMISAHEPMWNTSTCKTSISDMASIKTQLKNYMQTKGRNDFKVWNYIDNVSDLKNMPGFVSADIERVMDVAVTWQHCFGGAEGTCAGAKNKIIADRALIDNAGLNGKVDLVYLFQTFATGGGYSMPTLTDMQTWDCQFIATNALDGFIYYTWGAWYSTDLSDHPELWPEMNRVYDSCVNQAPDTSAPAVLSSVRDNVNPTSAISVDFTVIFSESVTGVTADDFFLTTSGVSGAAVSGVSGSGSVYTVTVNTGLGNGTIRLDVVDNNSIVDTASNPLGGAVVGDGNFTGGQIYDIEKLQTLMVVKSGTGSGTVRSDLIGINCGVDCSEVFAPNTVVTLTAVPDAGTLFTGWSGGGCMGASTCTVTMNATKSITAIFRTDGPAVSGDYNGDGRSDLAVFRPSTGMWIVKDWTTNTEIFRMPWDGGADKLVPADYNGDGKTDIAVFRASSLQWIVKDWATNTEILRMSWGGMTDIPVPGDYNGDGKADLAVYRPSTGMWIVKDWATNTEIFRMAWGGGADKPVPADYNGDGKTDIAVFRASSLQWIVKDWATNTEILRMSWGGMTDIPVPGDYNGDGKADLAVYRPSSGMWIVKDWTTNTEIFRMAWGGGADKLVPGDYNGDLKTDIGVFRASSLQWIVKDWASNTEILRMPWGGMTDIPLYNLVRAN